MLFIPPPSLLYPQSSTPRGAKIIRFVFEAVFVLNL
jgi:hypothetical protein